MTVLLDESLLETALAPAATLGDALTYIHATLPSGRIVTRISIDGETLTGPALTQARSAPIAGRTLAIGTADQKQLSLKMIGQLAALIEWLAPQHKEVAALLEKGDSGKGLERLGNVFNTWNQIQQSYGNLAKFLGITLKELPVRQLTGEAIMEEFCVQLGELQKALQNQDLVLVADILQYEMDGAVANWMAILESTLGVVEPAPTV